MYPRPATPPSRSALPVHLQHVPDAASANTFSYRVQPRRVRRQAHTGFTCGNCSSAASTPRGATWIDQLSWDHIQTAFASG